MRILKKIIGPVLAFFMTVYFAYHIFQGERGVISWLRLNKKVQSDEEILNELKKEKEAIECRVHLLKPENLDKDLLEEMAKKLLNYSDKEETIIIQTPAKIQLESSQGKHS